VGAWLLDRCPPDTRRYDALKNQPAVLAGIAVLHSQASLDALREVYRTARVTVLADVEPRAAKAALTALESLGAELAAQAREVALVAEAVADSAPQMG
jgi:hypothetical protein